jgi:integrase/recombinase XerD
MKIDRHGKATPITKDTYPKIRAAFYEAHHRLFFDIAYYTGERWGAICQLKVADVYTEQGKVRSAIVYRASTRKDGITREVPVSQELSLKLGSYRIPDSEWLFPSPGEPLKNACVRGYDAALRRAIDRAGLSGLGFSPHSTRRGLITALNNNGVSMKVIQSITGHKSIASLARYIDVSEEQRANALAAI